MCDHACDLSTRNVLSKKVCRLETGTNNLLIWPWAFSVGETIKRKHSLNARPSCSCLFAATDAARHWPAKPSHLIEDVARKDDLSAPLCGTARSKAVSDDRRVPKERVLHAGLPMVARRLLPASPSHLLDSHDRAITGARPRPVSRHVGRTRRRNHGGRATRTACGGGSAVPEHHPPRCNFFQPQGAYGVPPNEELNGPRLRAVRP